MMAITIGLSSCVPVMAELIIAASVTITNLVSGTAVPGDEVGATLSPSLPIIGYAWGSSPGASDYGTDQSLIVPAAELGARLYVTVTTSTGVLSASASIVEPPTVVTNIMAAQSSIDVQSLASIPPLATLTLSGGSETILVEIT